MSTVPAAPGLSIETLFGDLNSDQIIADEQDETPPLSTLGKRSSPPGQVSNDNNDNDEGNDDDEGDDPPVTEDRGPRRRSSPGTQTNPRSLRVEQAIRRMAKRLRLSDENTSLVEQFSQESSLEVQLTLLALGRPHIKSVRNLRRTSRNTRVSSS